MLHLSFIFALINTASATILFESTLYLCRAKIPNTLTTERVDHAPLYISLSPILLFGFTYLRGLSETSKQIHLPRK